MIKLNIQRFASTNQTTHYDLSQYVSNDKPTYLVDYNQDMSKIDTAIYGAESTATQASNNIGTMSNLDTTEKSSLVGAINEVKGEVNTNTNNINTLNTSVSANTGNIGIMANLQTTIKDNLVNAINEVKNDIPTVSDNILNNYSNSTTDSYSCDYINGIIESGSNPNGDYVKYPDGTMICYGNISFSKQSNNSLPNGGYRTAGGDVSIITFPIEFISIPKIAITTTSLNSINCYADNLYEAGFTALFATINSESSSSTKTASYIAIGKWK